jgi:Spy/CpxP family protein refolding chaperone
LNELLTADNPNRAAIDAKLQEVSASQMAAEKSAIDSQLAMREILTPAQRQQLQQLQQLRTNGLQPNGGTQPPAGAQRANRGASSQPKRQGHTSERQQELDKIKIFAVQRQRLTCKTALPDGCFPGPDL